MAGLPFLLLLPLTLWVPGRLLLAASGRGHAPAWTAIPLSYALWIACWAGATAVRAPVAAYELAWIALVAVLAFAAWRRGRGAWRLPRLTRAGAGTAVLFAALAAWLGWAGPYLEVPADGWWHLGEVRNLLRALHDGGAQLNPAWIGQEKAWYFLYAEWCRWSGLALERTPALVAFAGGLAVLWCYHGFAVQVFERARLAPSSPRILAHVAVVLFVAHFGVSVFSWLRYYAFAPTLLNFTLYLAVVALLFAAPGEGNGPRARVAAAVGLACAAWVVHRQEAIFAVVMVFLVVLAAGFLVRGEPQTRAIRVRAAWLALSAYAVAHVLAVVWLRRNSPELETPWLVPLPGGLPGYVARFDGHVYQALTAWGLAVYVLFAWRWRRFNASPYLLAGMLAPLVTVFNPLFVDLFLHASYPEVLWRFVYLVPLPMVGAVLLVDAARALVSRTARAPARVAALAACALLVGLLAPWRTAFGDLTWSRLYTLGPVDVTNSARLWDDLYDEMRRHAPARVLTDPVTGYTLAALTDHRYRGFKFYVTPAYPLSKEHYAPGDFARRAGMLLVINRRNGRGSRAGRISGHWPAQVMHVSRYYSPALVDFVNTHPALFRKTWERDRIAVYEIQAGAPDTRP